MSRTALAQVLLAAMVCFALRLGAEVCPTPSPVNPPGEPPPPSGGSNLVDFSYSCIKEDCTFVPRVLSDELRVQLQVIEWTWGDGSPTWRRYELKEVRYPYVQAVADTYYTATMKITFRNGQVETKSKNVFVTPVSPSAEFTYDNGWGQSVDLQTLLYRDDYGDASYAYLWDYGDDGDPDPDNECGGCYRQCKTYAQPGHYAVTLRVIKATEGTPKTVIFDESYTQVVDVRNRPADVSFTLSQAGKTISLDASATTDEPAPGQRESTHYPRPEANIFCKDLRTNSHIATPGVGRFEWDFGDGTYATGLTATHTYKAGRTYNVRLTVTDPHGDQSSLTKSVVIPNEMPVARFAFNCAGLWCQFDDTNSSDDNEIVSRTWSFQRVGSPAVTVPATGQPIARQFTDGTHIVRLEVSDGEFVTQMSRVLNITSAGSYPAQLIPTTPCRVFDSRTAADGEAEITARKSISIAGNPRCDVPSDARIAVVNLTVIAGTGGALMAGWPFANWQQVSYVNFYDPGRTPRANNAFLTMENDGTVSVFSTSYPFHLMVDVLGYFVPTTTARPVLGYQTIPWCRMLSVGLSSNTPYWTAVRQKCGVPVDAEAAALNVTVITAAKGGWLSIWPSDVWIPQTSNLNPLPQAVPISNGVPTRLGRQSTTDIGIMASGAYFEANVDVVGYFKPGGALSYHRLIPCRLLDTRDGAYGYARLQSNLRADIQVQGNCGVPRGAKAVVVNATAVGPSSGGHLSVFPSDAPGSAMMAFTAGEFAISNNMIMPLSAFQYDLSVLPYIPAAGAPSTSQLPDPAIVASSPAKAGGWGVSYIFDNNLNTDYAASVQGPGTFIDFDFGTLARITEVTFTDRRSSGLHNGQGTMEGGNNVWAYDLIFSVDATFGNADDVKIPVSSEPCCDTVTTSVNGGSGQVARYIRFYVTGGNSAGYLGAAEFSFVAFSASQLPNPAIIANSPAITGWEASYIFDNNPNTDFAGSAGTDTFIDFDFGSMARITEVMFTDRRSSNGYNGTGTLGNLDNVTSYYLIFSVDATFGNGDDITIPVLSPACCDTVNTSVNGGAGLVARYVRFDVTAGNSANLGAAEFRFVASPVGTMDLVLDVMGYFAPEITPQSTHQPTAVNGEVQP